MKKLVLLHVNNPSIEILNIDDCIKDVEYYITENLGYNMDYILYQVFDKEDIQINIK